VAAPRFGAVIDALVTLASTTSAKAVFDGPALSANMPADFVVIGGTEDPDDEPSDFTQTWNGLGARGKVETGDVTCAVIVGTGDEFVKVARDRALSILDEIETLVRADPTLGGVLTGGWCQVSGGRHVQRLNTQGLYARVVFTVSYQTKN